MQKLCWKDDAWKFKHKIFLKYAIGLFKRNVLLRALFLCVLLCARPGISATVSEDLARQVAGNFLNHLGASHTISSVEAVNNGEKPVGHLIQLSPGGYILVAGDDIRVPIKGYSLRSSFFDLPEAYRKNLLSELEIKETEKSRSLAAPDAVNSAYWSFLKENAVKTLALSYVPDTLLLTTRWSQNYPYNKLNPVVGDDLTLTGCVQTAMAQIMRYHAHPTAGTGVFVHDWNGRTLTAVMNRPFNWTAMPDKVNGSVPEYQQEEVAALMRDLGILNQADFGVSSTSTGFQVDDFESAFGYAPISTMPITNSAFFTTIKNEIDNLRPVLLSMPGHMTVADGYASDGTGRKIHLNIGWGGAYDDYYFLDETNIIGSYSFPPNHVIYYNIRPCTNGECHPYAPLGGGKPPVIASALPDLVIAGEKTLRIEAYDPEGDDVTLTAASACGGVKTELSNNLLTLTPQEMDIFCQVRIEAKSQDGTAVKTFNVLCLSEMIYLGTGYDIGGEFSGQNEVDEFRAYLGGDITISGDRGYSNQAFYIWVKDSDGHTVIEPDNSPISGTLTPGVYTICASLTSGLYYYPYDKNTSGYILSVAADDLTYTISDLADDLGISLISARLSVDKTGTGKGRVTSLPAGIDCGSDCRADFVPGAKVVLTAAPEEASMFAGWSGDCAGTGLTASVTINGDKQCTAAFETDGDGDLMPDAWEIANGLDPKVDDADADKDEDGVSNINEYHQGTNPDLPRPRSMPWIPLLLLEG
jgi:hypothetical protein